MGEPGGLRKRLRDSLTAAMRARDAGATAALRSAMSAIANAEAVDPAPARVRLGLGAGDVPRREVSEAEILAIMETEIDERLRAAIEYERLGRLAKARRLRSEADVLKALVAP